MYWLRATNNAISANNILYAFVSLQTVVYTAGKRKQENYFPVNVVNLQLWWKKLTNARWSLVCWLSIKVIALSKPEYKWKCWKRAQKNSIENVHIPWATTVCTLEYLILLWSSIREKRRVIKTAKGVGGKCCHTHFDSDICLRERRE